MVVVPGFLVRRTFWISAIERPLTNRCHVYTGTGRYGVWAAGCMTGLVSVGFWGAPLRWTSMPPWRPLSGGTNIRVMPDGLTAAHRLGLTNAVPAKVVYWTDGSTRTIPVGDRTIHLKHVRPGLIRWANHAAAPVVSAMMWLGPSLAVDSNMLDRLSQRLPMTVIKDLADGMSTLPAWMIPIAREITTPRCMAS